MGHRRGGEDGFDAAVWADAQKKELSTRVADFNDATPPNDITPDLAAAWADWIDSIATVRSHEALY